MPVTRSAGSDFSENVGKAVFQSAANTIALWTDPETQPFGIVDSVNEADPTQVSVNIQGERCCLKIAAGGIAAGVGLVTTVGATAKLTAPSAGEFCVAMSLHQAAAAEDALVAGVVNICQLSIAAEA